MKRPGSRTKLYLFLLETMQPILVPDEFSRQYLERHTPLQSAVLRQVNHAHPATPDLLIDSISSNLLAG